MSDMQSKYRPHEYPRRQLGSDTVWLVHESSDQYRAWKYWLRHAIGRNFFPEPVMAVWGEWPPRSQMAADNVAKMIQAVRDEANKDIEREHKGRGGFRRCDPVPNMHPEPWDGYVPPLQIEERRDFPKNLRPWREILAKYGQVPAEGSSLARALDELQRKEPPPRR